MKKKVRFSKKVKIIIIDNNNNGTPVYEVSSILDDLSKPVSFKPSIQNPVLNFLQKLNITIVKQPIIYKDNKVFIGKSLSSIKQDDKLIVIQLNKTDFLIFNPKFHSIEWLSYETNKELLKKLKEIFKTIGYKILKPVIFPNLESMMLFIQMKSKYPSLMSQSFLSQFRSLKPYDFYKKNLIIHYQLTSKNISDSKTKSKQLSKLSLNELMLLYNKLVNKS